jgi:hypothetical protein
MSPWDIDDFNRFSTFASPSLYLLHPTNYEPGPNEALQTKLSFRDLPTFIIIIRTNFPNLRHLTLAMSGVETAEKICKEMLDEDSLNDGGSIQSLVIRVSPSSTPLFNIIRCLSPLLLPDGVVELDGLESGMAISLSGGMSQILEIVSFSTPIMHRS